MANKSQMTSTKIQINLNNPNFNIQSCFGHLKIDIWNLFTHKIINFKGVHEITSFSCYLFFAIWCFISKMFDFMDKLSLV